MNAPIAPAPPALTAKDFASARDVYWCPGCGDHAILATVKKILAKTGARPENTVFVSGIGCSSRFPYYINTYGFHSIHGRAPTLATGLKIARPELSVWMVTGDGDGLAIGGNHMMHMIRRNLDITVLLFNNRIYGLTKGQYSPTSEYGKLTKSSPYGTVEQPVRPLSVALGSESTFAARTLAIDIKHLEYVLERAAKHRGTSFVEIYQNCVIFNENSFDWATDKAVRGDNIVYLEDGKPLTFGLDSDNPKAIRLVHGRPEVINLKDARADELLIHDEGAASPAQAYMLAQFSMPDFPEPLGVFRCVERPTLDAAIYAQIDQAVKAKQPGDISQLLAGPETWTVTAKKARAPK